jgi:hypothetical protein
MAWCLISLAQGQLYLYLTEVTMYIPYRPDNAVYGNYRCLFLEPYEIINALSGQNEEF